MSNRLLVVTTSYPYDQQGVSGIFVRRLNDALSQYFRLRVICPAGKKDFEGDVIAARYAPKKLQLLAHNPGGIPVAIRSNPFLVFFIPVMLLSMFFSCLKHLRSADFLICHWAINGLVAGVANLFFRRDSIVVFHGTDANKIEASKLSRLIAYLAVRLSGHAIAVSVDIEKKLKSAFPDLASQIAFIPNGVEESFLVDRTQTKMPTITTIANLNPLKGVQDVLAAIKPLTDQSFHLEIVGDGVQRKELEHYVSNNGLSEFVTFRGLLAPSEVTRLLLRSDVFVLASYSEGRPSVLLEAMAAGCACCGSSLPGILELVEHGETGLIFEPGNVEEIRHSIERLIKDEAAMRDFGVRARCHIVDKGLTWEKTAVKYREVFQLESA